jgi:hypothetical protein
MGDQDDAVLYTALGRAIDRWEHIEYGLALLYSLFVNDPTFAAMKDYGAGNIFRDRLTGLQKVAAAWFVKTPCQDIEGEFDRLMTAARGFSDRRNEFAHGIVMDVSGFTFWRLQMRLALPDTRRFIVMPAMHIIRKHDETGMPTFGYSSLELSVLQERMLEYELDIDRFTSRLWPERWPSIEQ